MHHRYNSCYESKNKKMEDNYMKIMKIVFKIEDKGAIVEINIHIILDSQ